MGHFISIQRDSIVFIMIWTFIGCIMAFTGCDTPAATNTEQEQVVVAAKADRGIITTETGLKIRVTILPGWDSTASSQPLSMNNLGQIVGGSGGHAVMWENGKIKDISQGRSLTPYSINDHGVIVGALSKGHTPGGYAAFKMKNGEITDLCNIVGTSTRALAINNKNQVVGRSKFGSFVYDHGKVSYYRDVRPDAYLYGRTTGAINEKGHFTGWIYKDDPSIEQIPGSIPEWDRTPVLWKDGEFIELGLLGGGQGNEWADLGQATSINDHDQVVGFSKVTRHNQHAFLWEDGVMTDLGFLGKNPVNINSENSWANSINNKGQIVGSSDSYTNGRQRQHAFLWENGEMIDIGTEEILGIQTTSEALVINEQGQIVGTFRDFSNDRTRAVLWEIME